MKQTTYVRRHCPDATITIYYIDLRAMDRYEGFQKRIEQDPKIRWIRSKPARIEEDPETKDPIVIGEDTLTGLRYAEAYDMVVLATGMVPNAAAGEVPIQGIKQDPYGFMLSGAGGVHAGGCAVGPLDVASSVQTGTAAALRAIQSVAKGRK